MSADLRMPSAHRVAFYDSESFFIETVAGFVVSALSSGSAAVTLLTDAHRDAVDRALFVGGVDLGAARRRGDYRAFDANLAVAELTAEGEVSTAAFDALAEEVFGGTAGHGRETSVCGEVSPLLWQAGDLVGARRVEELCNALPQRPAHRILCTYPLQSFDGSATDAPFVGLCGLHGDVTPAEEHAGLEDPSELRRAIALMQHHRRAARIDHRQLREAIATRDVIGQAKGILMARLQIDADAAFDVLRAVSNRSNRRVLVVAEDVVGQYPRTA